MVSEIVTVKHNMDLLYNGSAEKIYCKGQFL